MLNSYTISDNESTNWYTVARSPIQISVSSDFTGGSWGSGTLALDMKI